MSRFDSIYLKKKHHHAPVMVQEPEPIRMNFVYQAPSKPPLYYFYKSLKVVLVIWVLLLGAVIITPWANYYVKTRLGHQVLGVQNQTTVNNSQPKVAQPTFYLKKGDLEIKAPIIEGITAEDLNQGVGHHPDSVWPNEKGNMVVAGHSFSLEADNPYGQVFGRLRELEVGDEVLVVYLGKRYTYKIFNRQVTSPSDLTLMGKTPDKWVLTFYTCDPPKTDWRRLVFQAELIKIE